MRNKISLSQAEHRQSWNIYSRRFKHLIPVLSFASMLFTTAVFAGPAEDTQKGMDAFLSGDTVGAMRLYRKAAEQGYAPAQEKLAHILDQSEFNEEALEWFRKAAEQNNAEGQYGLGMMYLAGDGVEKDTEQALQLIQTAAEQGLLRAMMSMFHISKNGEHGHPVDLKLAVSWLEKIAASDNQWAIEKLAKGYRNGELGLAINDEKALFWESRLKKSAP